MIDPDPALDFTATRVLVEPDASGVISIVVHTEDGRWDLASGELRCSTFGRPVSEVRGELEAAGYTVEVTPVVLDRSNASGPFGVASAALSADSVRLIAQPLTELPDSAIGCR